MPQAGYVYIVHGIGTNYIKVGKTTNVMGRLRALNQHAPFPLRLLSVRLVADMDAEEARLLTYYRPYRTQGEWAALPPDLLNEWPMDAEVAPFTYLREPSVPVEQPQKVRVPRRRHTEAQAWLEEYLQDGERPALEVMAAATAVGMSRRTLWRAKRTAAIESVKRLDNWYWKPPVREDIPEEIY